MPDLILRESMNPDDSSEPEVARAFVPDECVEDVLMLVSRAIQWGYDMTFVEVEEEDDA